VTLNNLSPVTYNCWSFKSSMLDAQNLLTLEELAYDIFVLRFQPKKQQFSVALPTP